MSNSSSSSLEELGIVSELQLALKTQLKALHIDQQHLQQTTQLLGTHGSFRRSQAANQVAQQQYSFASIATQFKQDAAAVQRVKHANTIRLQYDQAAVDKVLHCMKLEQDARSLDSWVGKRQYNRLHPRYSLQPQ